MHVGILGSETCNQEAFHVCLKSATVLTDGC